LRTWRLQHRKLGTSSWATVDSGSRTGLKAHHHVSVEDDDEFRVVALDRHGNRRISPVRRVSVPIDDASPPLVYTGTWTHGPGNANDFRDTLSSSGTPTDTVTLTFTGRYVAWVAPGGGDGQATVATAAAGVSVRLQRAAQDCLPAHLPDRCHTLDHDHRRLRHRLRRRDHRPLATLLHAA
jgi:hypothetical protein